MAGVSVCRYPLLIELGQSSVLVIRNDTNRFVVQSYFFLSLHFLVDFASI
jgi:hypothetical protein